MVLETNKTITTFFKKYKYQIIATFGVNLIAFSHGIGLGWIAPILSMLLEPNDVLNAGKITLEEASWIGALVCAGGLTGNLLFGTLLHKIGRKKTLCIIALPQALFWLTIMFGNHVYHLYLARVFYGTSGGGIFVVIPLYIAEIADNKIRGTLGSMFILFINTGILGGYIFGTFVAYSLIPMLLISIPIIYVIVVSLFLPDTPQYLIQVAEDFEAEKSLKFYRNFKGNTKEETREFNEEFNNLKKGVLHSTAEEKISFKDFCEPVARKGLIIGFALLLLNQFSGYFAIINYLSTIFQESGSVLHHNTSAIIIGVIQLLGTYVAAILVDRVGRKILLTISTIGVAVGLATLGTYSYCSKQHDLQYLNWIPIFSLSLVILTGALGIIPLPFVVLAEVLPQKIRLLASTFCMCTLSVMAFTVLKIYPILMDTIHLYNLMWLCSIFCICGTVFIIFQVPETNGKAIQ